MDLKERGTRDVLTASKKTKEVYYFEGNADGTFKPARRLMQTDGSLLKIPGVEQIAAADWNSDGHLDLIAGGSEGLFFCAGTGNGMFEKPVELKVAGQKYKFRRPGYAIPNVADWDGDGTPDLLVTESGDGGVVFFRGIPQPAGVPLKLEPGKWLIAPLSEDEEQGLRLTDEKSLEIANPRSCYYSRVSVADWNGDGKPDLIVGGISQLRRDMKQGSQSSLDALKAQLIELAGRRENWTEADRKRYGDINQAISRAESSPLAYSFVWVYLRK